MNEGGYREPAPRPTRRTDLRATVFDGTAYLFVPFLLIAALLPFYFTASGVDVACKASGDTCVVATHRVFGAVTEEMLVDLSGSGDVRIVPGKHPSLEVVASKGPREYEERFGGGETTVVDTLRKFRAEREDQRIDITASHRDVVTPLFALILGLVGWFCLFQIMVARVRIVAETDDVQMTLVLSRWPMPARRFTFDANDVVGADVRAMARRTGKGGTVRNRTIDLRLRTSDQDLFPRPLPDSDQVDELARSLDAFVRLGQRDIERTTSL